MIVHTCTNCGIEFDCSELNPGEKGALSEVGLMKEKVEFMAFELMRERQKNDKFIDLLISRLKNDK